MTKRILIVDDDSTVVTSLRLVLKRAGLKSDGADRPESAFKLLEKKH
jgi:DNA-binding NtrC family response regulator